MGYWSSSAPAGVSFGAAASGLDVGNNVTVSVAIQAARGSGQDYYLKVTAHFSAGEYGTYYPPETYYFRTESGDSSAFTQPGQDNNAVAYYYGTGAPGSVTAGISIYSTHFSGSGYATVGVPAVPTYAVQFAAGGGSGSMASQTKTGGVALTLAPCTFTRQGYAFDHWSGSDGGTYANGGTFTGNYAVTMTAVWIRTVIPVYVNDAGVIKQVEKILVNDDGVIREATLYINDNGTIRALL